VDNQLQGGHVMDWGSSYSYPWQRRFRRRVVIGGLGAAGAAAYLAACGGKSNSKPAGTAAPTAPGVAATTGSNAATARAAGASPQASLPTDLTKMSLEQIRSQFSGARFKDLSGQKSGPATGGTLRFASQTPVTWDPSSPAGSLLASYMFAHNQLIQFKINDFVNTPNLMEVEPVLAQAMPEQPDAQTFIFRLRKGVKFQNVAPVNGREFTSDDVVYTTQVYQKAPAQAPTFADLDHVDAPDPYTVSFHMGQPAAYFLGSFVIPFHWIFAKEQHQSPDGLAKIPIGTGGFLFDSSQNLAGYKFKRNPAYFRTDPRTNKQLPYVDAVETSFYPDLAQQIAAFRSNQLDHLYPQTFDNWVSVVKTNPESVSQVTTPPPSFQPFIGMRVDKAPLSDVRVRRALSLLIDRGQIITSLLGGMGGLGYGQDWTYFGQEWPWQASQLGKWMGADPKQASQLLSAAGVSNLTLDFLMTSYFGFNYTAWNAVAGMWGAAGVKTNINAPQDPAQWQQQFYSGTYNHLVGTGLIGPGWDPDAFAYGALYSKSPKNYYHVNDPQIDALALKQRQTMDVEARKKILLDLMAYDVDQVTRLWITTPYKVNLRKPNVYNLTDTEAAWFPVGWGSLGMDMAWKSA
jgi:peptide/nickel transport system substrate-binding protein